MALTGAMLACFHSSGIAMITEPSKLASKFFDLGLEDRGVMFRHTLVRSKLANREALELMAFIQAVWMTERGELEDIPCDSSPDLGMLVAVGYRVGEAGVETAIRRLILDYLLTEDALPAIHGLGYMREWGLASEPIRRLKLQWVISNLMHEKWDIGKHGKAVREWKADLGYLAKVGVGPQA